jgi:hypothetical protein
MGRSRGGLTTKIHALARLIHEGVGDGLADVA